MTPKAVIADAKVREQRARPGAGPDAPATIAAGQDFGGVLTDIGEQTKAAGTPKALAATTIPSAARTIPSAAKTIPSAVKAPPSTATPPQTVALAAPVPADDGSAAIKSLVGKIIAAPPPKTKVPEVGTTDQDDTSPSSARTAPAATPVPLDLLAMLATPVAGAPSRGTSGSIETSGPAASAALHVDVPGSIGVSGPAASTILNVDVPGSTAEPSPGAQPAPDMATTADAPIIASVAMATQLAPAARTPIAGITAVVPRAGASPVRSAGTEATTHIDEETRSGAPYASAGAPADVPPSQASQSRGDGASDDGASHAPAALPVTDAAGDGGIAAFSMSGATPVQSLAQAVSDLAASASAAVPAKDTTSVAAGPLAPARTMVLQMSPSELGTVSVRLHLTGRTLDVQLSVSEPRTLGLISSERDALSSALADRAYQINSLVIQSHDPQASPAAGLHDSTATNNGADSSSRHGAAAAGGSGTGRDGARRDDTDRESARRSPNQRGAARAGTDGFRSVGGGLFV